MSESEPARASVVKRAADRRFWASVSAVLGALAAATGILAFTLELLPGSGSATCDGRSDAALENPTVHESTLGDFMLRFSSPEGGGDPTDGYTPEQLGTRVQYVSVGVAVFGQRGKPVTLRWAMEDASKGGAGRLPPSRNAATIIPPTCEHRHPAHLLLDPPVPVGRAVFVTLSLHDEEGTELGREQRTKAIRAVS